MECDWALHTASNCMKTFSMFHFAWRSTEASHLALSNVHPPSSAFSMACRVFGCRAALNSANETLPSLRERDAVGWA